MGGWLLRVEITLWRVVSLVGKWLVASSALALAAGAVTGASPRTQVTGARSPCDLATLVASSPDGRQIAWVGYEWRVTRHGRRIEGPARAICVAVASGARPQALRYTVCTSGCSRSFISDPRQLDWTRGNRFVYLDDGQIFSFKPGRSPKLVTGNLRKLPGPGFAFSIDASGDRVAYSGPFCPEQCAGPVAVLNAATGSVVGEIGNRKSENLDPSLSPDGTQVVFDRSNGNQNLGIWLANSTGGNLHRLEPSGDTPYWSPAGNMIAYTDTDGLHLVSTSGGASTPLVRGSVQLFSDGWSPNGRWFALDHSADLEVVNVVTGKVRKLVRADTFAWSPGSRQLLVIWRAPSHTNCPYGLWRVPIDGSKPRLVHGCQ